MSTGETLTERRTEFESHVWNHAEDAFQMSFDERVPLTASQFGPIQSVIELIRDRGTTKKIGDFIYQEMNQDPSIIFPIMQIVGLTRNKILQDLKGSLAGSSTRIPSSADKLHRNSTVWGLAGPYLSKRLMTVLSPLVALPPDQIPGVVESLNQATWPGWIRQERAKRSGHQAEYRLANLFAALKLPFSPAQKADNPLCRDAQVDGISYDLVVPNESEPALCFKATVHTSNIGQYGESKDALEVAEAKSSLQELATRPLLMTLIDGVGFRSNRAGLDGVLDGADEFCQFATLWKAAVVAAHCVCSRLIVALPDHEEHRKFLQRYEYAIELLSPDHSEDIGLVRAGEARLKLLL